MQLDFRVLVRSIIIMCSVVGAAQTVAVLVSKHGFVFAPLYAGAVWGAYFLQTWRKKWSAR